MLDRKSSLELARLRRESISAPEPKPKTVTERLSPYLPFVQAMAVLLLGYWLVQRVELSLKDRDAGLRESQHSIQAINALETLLAKIDGAATPAERESAVVQVAMHGEAAIYPLFVLAVSKNPYPAEAVVPGLRLLAVRHRKEICLLLQDGLQVKGAVNGMRETSINELVKDICHLPDSRR